jgi:arylsulfatase A-like enzyme
VRRRLLGILAASIALTNGCGPQRTTASAHLPNLLVVTLDTVRADHLSIYGYERDTSPQLAKLAAEGVRFDRAYAAASTTLPSHVSLFTGEAPITHGVVKNGVRLRPDAATLADRMRAAGAQTAGIVSSFVLDRRFGLDQGFDHYEDDFTKEGSSYTGAEWKGFETRGAFDRRANLTTDRAIEWLDTERDRTRPFFLWVHYFDPHDPYTPPEPWKSRFAQSGSDSLVVKPETIGAYDGEVAFTDDELGRLLDHLGALGLANDTLVVVTADHGEGLGQHGVIGHVVNIYEEAVHVPLLLRWPGHLPAGRTIDGPVESVDVLPTVLELLGLTHEGVGRGRSLAGALLRGDALDAERPVFTHRRPFDEPAVQNGRRVHGALFGVLVGSYKWIEGTSDGTRELYDLASDPHETANLAARDPERAAALSKEIAAFRKAHARAPSDATVSPEDRERLRALGYAD